MADSSNHNGNLGGDSGMIEFTGKIMVVAIILLFFVVLFVFCLHLYAKWFWYRRQETTTTGTTRRRRLRLDFAAGYQEITVVGKGLDPLVLKTIPVITFDPKQFKDGLECAVCLCEVSQGEKTRLLPKCSHGFHVECIDMWFQSHSTCPLCRNPVSNRQEQNPGSESAFETMLQPENSLEVANFPTNVLFWGDETRVSTFGPCLEEDRQSSNVAECSSSSSLNDSTTRNGNDGVLVIDVPRQVNEEEEQKSMVPTRLRSLKRLLSGNNRRVNPSSPRNFDIEQGP